MGASWLWSSSLGDSGGGDGTIPCLSMRADTRLYAFVRIHRTVYQEKQVLLHVNFYKWKFLSNYFFYLSMAPHHWKGKVPFALGQDCMPFSPLVSSSLPSDKPNHLWSLSNLPASHLSTSVWSSSKGLVHHLTSSIPGPQNKQLELQTGWVPCSSAKCVSSFKPPCPCECSAWKILFPSHFHIAW